MPALSKLQTMLLDMMKWFHHYCEENHLQYYMVGGTMLGAARHRGFIPWDDDVDVGLPRRDYQKLITLLEPNTAGRWILESPCYNVKGYDYPFAKLYDTSTTLIENKKHRLRRGIFIDIFPLDGVGNSEKECQKHYSEIRKANNLYLLRHCWLRKGRKWYKNLGILMMNLIPEPILGAQRLWERLDLLSQKYDFQEAKWVANFAGAWGAREIVLREVMGKPSLYEFEDAKFYGVEDYDKYLTHLYGDWRQLPPKEKQISHHDVLKIDLNKPYKENEPGM